MFENFDGTPCIVKNCKSDVVTRGLCRSHYNLFIRGGLHRIIIEPLPSTKTITKKSVCSKTRDVNKPITKKKILYGVLGLEGMAEKEWRAFFLFPSIQKGYKDGKCRDCGQPYGQPHIKFSELYTQGNKRNKTRTLTPADELQKQKYIIILTFSIAQLYCFPKKNNVYSARD